MYKAFISYSHASDAAFAPSLQSALEKFAKPWFRMRSFRIFRDTTNLSVTPQLWPAIEKALAESEYLLLLASPKASGSRWITKELNYWRTNKDIFKLFIIQTSGEIRWDESAVDFDWDKTTSIPLELKGAFVQEPLFPDFRELAGLPCSLDDNAFLERVATIAAPLHGLSKDEIFGEHIRQHRKTMRLAWLAVTVLLLLAGTSILMWYQASAARSGERLAKENAEKAYNNEKVAHLEVEAELRLSKLQSALALFGARKVNEMHAILDAMPAKDRTWLHHFLSTSPPQRPKTIFKTQWLNATLQTLSKEQSPPKLVFAHYDRSSLACGGWMSLWRESPPTFLAGISSGGDGYLPICKMDSGRSYIFVNYAGGEKYGATVNGAYSYRGQGYLRIPIANAVAVGPAHQPPTATNKYGENDWDEPYESTYSVFTEQVHLIAEEPLSGTWVDGKFICERLLSVDEDVSNSISFVVTMGKTWHESEGVVRNPTLPTLNTTNMPETNDSGFEVVSRNGRTALVALEKNSETPDDEYNFSVIDTESKTTLGSLTALRPHRGSLDFAVSNDGNYVVVNGSGKFSPEGWYVEKLNSKEKCYETMDRAAFEETEDAPSTKWLLSDDGDLVVGVGDQLITLIKGDDLLEFPVPSLTLDTVDARRCAVSLEHGLAIIGTIILDLHRGRIVGHLPLGIAISPDWRSAVLADVNGRIVRWELGLNTPSPENQSNNLTRLATLVNLESVADNKQKVRQQLEPSPPTFPTDANVSVPRFIPTASIDFTGERFPETRTAMIPNKRVLELSLTDIRYAINEMIARHGGTFQKSVQDQFEQFDWYSPRQGVSALQIETQEFSAVERYNFKLLGARRDQLKKVLTP